jgi:hypothetical protein
MRPVGQRVGFRDGEDIYLIPRAAHKVARDMTRGSPYTLSLTERMFHKSLFEEGLLKSTETRGGKLYHTVRKQIGGKRLPVLRVNAESLGLGD